MTTIGDNAWQPFLPFVWVGQRAMPLGGVALFYGLLTRRAQHDVTRNMISKKLFRATRPISICYSSPKLNIDYCTPVNE